MENQSGHFDWGVGGHTYYDVKVGKSHRQRQQSRKCLYNLDTKLFNLRFKKIYVYV